MILDGTLTGKVDLGVITLEMEGRPSVYEFGVALASLGYILAEGIYSFYKNEYHALTGIWLEKIYKKFFK